MHAILEIGARHSLTSAALAEALGLEKSSVSRLVHKLIDANEHEEAVSHDDGRAKCLTLTAKGRRTLAAIDAHGRKQVTTALAWLSESEQHAVGRGLATYAHALEAHRLGKPPEPPESIEILQGYRPGVIGRAVEMHARFYSRRAGFGQVFESLVAAGLAEFAARLTNPRNGLWVAVSAGRIVGSVAIDGEDSGNDTGHLRWFIVNDGMRGAGIGRRLLTAALAFADHQGFASVHLWTFRGLDAARRLYENSGFGLDEERAGIQWGNEVVEQRFVRERHADST